jgi:bis(5'-adenosyl)-triphosphatase
MTCPFCLPEINDIAFAEGRGFRAFSTNAPILPGHTLIAPMRHVERTRDLSSFEMSGMALFAQIVEQVLSRSFKTESFNWTIQQGAAAGQTVPHLHLHLIPRILGDLPSPGDWYPRIKFAGEEVDSEKRSTISLDEMHRMAKHLRSVSREFGVWSE